MADLLRTASNRQQTLHEPSQLDIDHDATITRPSATFRSEPMRCQRPIPTGRRRNCGVARG
jgi:hypothetical protein